MTLVAGVKQNHIVGSLGRNQRQDRFGQVAVRVDEAATPAGRDVRGQQVQQKRALAHAGLADNI